MKPQFKNFALLVILLCTVISCSENKISQPEDFLIYLPAVGEIIYTGTMYTISWNHPTWSCVDIELISISGNSWLIGKALPNSGSYFWDIPLGIPDGSDYSIAITNSQDPGSSVTGGSFEIRSQGEISSFTDNRDGQTYKTVKIGIQWWMAENFNYSCEGSNCYKDIESHCQIYGRLYTLEAAKENSPPGWHLPTDNEWKQLETYLGITEDEIDNFGERGLYAGLLLAKDGGPGFDALYGGYRNICVGNKDGHKNWESHFWTSTLNADSNPICRVITRSAGGVVRLATFCHGGSAVRYVQDSE